MCFYSVFMNLNAICVPFHGALCRTLLILSFFLLVAMIKRLVDFNLFLAENQTISEVSMSNYFGPGTKKRGDRPRFLDLLSLFG